MVSAVVGLGLAATLLLGASVQVASAQGISISQLLQVLVAAGVIAPDKLAAAQAAVAAMGSTTSAPSYAYNTNLTVGSTGADVTALQNALGVSPATGYFGSITKAAVVSYQTAHGIPSTGFVGPLTRASLNGSSTSVTTTTTTTNSSTGSNTTSTSVTNTGVEGILTVNLASNPSSGQNVYEADSQDALLGIKLQAQLSPITIQRVQLDLGTATTFYTKYFSTLYLVSDTGAVLAQAALNSHPDPKQTSTSGGTNTYFLTFSGFNYTVPGDNSVHVLTVKGDLYSSIDSTLAGSAVKVSIDQNGIRGVDGAGVDQYGPTGTIYNTVTINKSLASNATLQLSTDSATPLQVQSVATQGALSTELDGQTALVFDLYAQKDWVQLDNLTAGLNGTSGSGTASATTAYLYAGSNQISSAAISYNGTGQYGTAAFTNVNYQIPQNTTQPFTIKVDIKNANTSSRTWYATVTSGFIVAENSQGNTVTPTGSATGNSVVVTSAGPVFSLVGTPTITTQTSSLQNNQSTTTALATFNVQIQALGTNVYFFNQNAAAGNAGMFNFDIYAGGSAQGLASSTYSAVTSWTVPSSGVISSSLPYGADAFELQQNNTIQLPVTFTFQNKTTAGVFVPTNTYAVGLDSINWSTNGTASSTSSFMNGLTSWRTAQVSLP